MKTGYTKEAGYCLVASSKKENMRLITVVLGTESTSARTQESQKLLNFGFRFYESHLLFKSGQAIKTVKAYKGNSAELQLGLLEDLYITIPRGSYKNLKPDIHLAETIIAPVARGQEFGSIEISLNNKLLINKPIVALHDIKQGSLWQRGRDSALLLFK